MQKLRKFPKFTEEISQRCLYAFGPFQVDPVKRLLLRSGELISLSPKDFDLLCALVQYRGEVLLKEELMHSLWPDTVVEEGNLNRHISTIRKALGESPNEHQYIVTVPGRGYRFVAAVVETWGEGPQPLVHEADAISLVGGDAQSSTVSISSLSAPIAPIAGHPYPWATRMRLSKFGTWILGGIGALLAVLIAVLILPLRSKPVLATTDQVLISDFVNTTNDPVFDDTLKQAVSVQLSQSPFLNIVSDARVGATLKLMTKAPDTRLTPDVAREVCQRSDSKVYIAGTLARLGGEFVIGLNAVNCWTGDSVAQEQVAAKSKEEVLKALDEASGKIRRRLGESQGTLQRYDTPLVQATTPSLEALNAFSQGDLARDRKGEAAAIPFFKHAIELDPQFALAYNALGLTYSNLDEPGLASENISKAYALRDRASELEKFHIAANYSQIVTGELEKANQVSELWAQTYSRDPYPHNLMGVNFEFLGQYDKAAEEILEAIRRHPDGVVLRSDLMEDYIALNQLDQAKAAYQAALARNLDHAYLHADRYAVAFLEGDRAEMDRQVAWAAARPGAEDLLLSVESDTGAFQGSLGKAREHSRRATDSALRAGQKETAALWLMNAALREVELGNVGHTRRDVRAGLMLASSRDVRVLGALALARAGDLGRAKKMEEDLVRDFPLNTVINNYWLPVIRAAVEIDQKNPVKAIELLQVTAPYELAYPNPQVGVGRFLYPVYLRGEAYLRLHQADKAVAEYQKFLGHSSIVVNCPLGSFAHVQLGRAYSALGDRAKARSAYQDFFKLWKDADPDIPILKEAKAEFAKLP
jgi:eukaryotic-like serine/threonine-protein kinase